MPSLRLVTALVAVLLFGLVRLLFFDLFGFDRSLVGWIEVHVGLGGFTQVDPILGQLYG